MDINDEPRLTRAELAKRLTEAGYPVALGSLNTWGSIGGGPPVDGYWGRRPMYRWSAAKVWAEQKFKTQPPARPQREPKKSAESGHAHA
jgi:hypothetical protein